MTDKKKQHPFSIDRDKRKARRNALRRVEQTYGQTQEDGSKVEKKTVIDKSLERAESLSIVQEMAQAFASTMEFYKTDWGGAKPHEEAVKEALLRNEWRRGYVEGLPPEKVDWSHLAAVAEVDVNDSLTLWARVREAADDELESGRRAAQVTGNRTEPYALAQFAAIRDSFADQWQPNGGIESAMIDMMTIAFSLQMYWSTIAHQRAIQIHNSQEKELKGYDNKGWKSPYQHEAGAIEQAHRLADGYNRQFLRVLRQLRDLRRYAPVIIQNNGGQVNVGEQQINVQQPK
ncbi:MAG: hypothetical protein M3367_00120 [Acidobacteriota bacterium]|nr:hypothetical protein [Acidobacteriota bacterium]